MRKLNTKTIKKEAETVEMREVVKRGQYTSEEFMQVWFGFVQGRFPIFVTDAHLSPISHKVLRERRNCC